MIETENTPPLILFRLAASSTTKQLKFDNYYIVELLINQIPSPINNSINNNNINAKGLKRIDRILHLNFYSPSSNCCKYFHSHSP